MADDLERDIRFLEKQERILRFETFGPDAAWGLGSLLREMALKRGAAIAVDISLRDRPLFHTALPGTSTDNAEWIRRKRNTVLRLWKSSYLVGRKLELAGRDQQEAHNLPLADFASHGGGFPIVLADIGCIGVVTVSGVPQREDHAIVADGIAAFLGKDIDACRLPA